MSMDFRYAWRSLSRTPGFAALVILTLALGLGATTTMFSVVWAVFFRPLPLPAQDRIVTLWQSDGRTRGAWQHVTPANFVDWRAQSSSFEALGALPNWSAETSPFNVVGPNGTERVQGVYASSGFFEVMGVPPLVGRLFETDDDRKPGRRRAVISHAYWQSRFAGDRSAVGRTFEVDTWGGGGFTIIGVMPPAFDFPRGASIWLSLADWGGGPMPQPGSPARCCPWFTTFGRLKPGVTIDRARAELTGIAQHVSSTHPGGGAVAEVRVVPLRETLAGDHALTLFGLFGAVGCILLIGSANVANLLLSRGVSRRREVMTRLALGATRWRLARQLLTESLMLGAAGAGLGLLLSLWAHDVVATRLAGRIALIEGTRLDTTVLAFSACLAAIVSAACGLIPLVDWRAAGWSARGQTETPASRRTRDGLAVAELAVAVIVVATAGLLVRTVVNLRSVDVGFDTERTLVVSTDLTSTGLRERGAAARFVEQLIPRIAAVPGVRAAAATTVVPLEGGPARQAITRYGDPAVPSAASPQVIQTAVTTGYFKAMGIAVTRGRVFTEEDRADGHLVAVVNETAARRYWPGEDPVGSRFAVGSSERFGSFRRPPPGGIEWREIVGVVADVRSAGFASSVQPEVFYSYKQFPVYEPSLIVRTAGDPAALTQAIRSQVAAVNARAVVTRVRTLDDVADQTIADPRLRATLASAFSTLALMLGMLGIYGVMSYTVAQRTREIGIRMALGARRSQVARMIMGKALRLAAIGVGLGLIGAYAAARWISSLFFGVGPADAATLSAACLLLIGAAAAASLHPMRHAIRVEPAVALRNE
jgi:putative ABC transport system permease protein